MHTYALEISKFRWILGWICWMGWNAFFIWSAVLWMWRCVFQMRCCGLCGLRLMCDGKQNMFIYFALLSWIIILLLSMVDACLCCGRLNGVSIYIYIYICVGGNKYDRFTFAYLDVRSSFGTCFGIFLWRSNLVIVEICETVKYVMD